MTGNRITQWLGAAAIAGLVLAHSATAEAQSGGKPPVDTPPPPPAPGASGTASSGSGNVPKAVPLSEMSRLDAEREADIQEDLVDLIEDSRGTSVAVLRPRLMARAETLAAESLGITTKQLAQYPAIHRQLRAIVRSVLPSTTSRTSRTVPGRSSSRQPRKSTKTMTATRSAVANASTAIPCITPTPALPRARPPHCRRCRRYRRRAPPPRCPITSSPMPRGIISSTGSSARARGAAAVGDGVPPCRVHRSRDLGKTDHRMTPSSRRLAIGTALAVALGLCAVPLATRAQDRAPGHDPSGERQGEEGPAQEEGAGPAAERPTGRSSSRPTRGPGSRSTSRPTARRSSSSCSATFIPCRSTAARPRRSPPGMAFDSQPSYSPDGKMIAFVSDRDGAENLWVAGGGRLGRPAADQGQAEPVRLAVVDARRRLRARLATAAAPLGRVRAVDVPRPRRLRGADHQGQAQARRQAR